ncbi:hypothetical protein, partial [Geodermatophilus sp. TF02-6]|uniref:hypothetical protein n=1 Tax=Geodermatophilus sp. TF02-6 TaxID=2250575 RepID=UPI0018F61C9D
MPSVEAATREGAIAAARERYGSSVRIVGIRRVRTGGVMGFFTTERFVAEVEEAAPTPVERRPASRAESLARIEAAVRRSPVLPDPVDEVADLLGGDAGESAVGLYSRTAGPRAPRPAAARPARAAATAPASPAPAAPAAPPAADDAELPPSPFTAALAQMVAGDLDVREAVEEAVAAATPAPAPAPPAEPVPAVESVPAVEPVPLPELAAEVPAPLGAHPPAPPAPQPLPAPQPFPAPQPLAAQAAPVPDWVHEPDLGTGPITSREEAIAEVLRAALARDTSDAALT